jgi:cellulose synthase/poly-beta-1,6-N-acetylglucosamine synthase-like glycosyltransferase
MQRLPVLHGIEPSHNCTMTGVSFVVPVHNGAAHLAEVIASIAAQGDGRPFEIVVVEDGSTDGSAAVVESLAERYPITIARGPGRGAAAAVNTGIRLASHPIVCQVDQDVVLERGWMQTLAAALEDPMAGAAQGRYVVDPGGSFFARVMALDLEQRYLRVGTYSDHVCTGNTAYRAAALQAIGLLDESLGYGYDNDLSYRLHTAGFRLLFCRGARSRHRWREGLVGYLLQQYGFGYGRLDVVARHPARYAGDAVSPAAMMWHPLVMAMAMGAAAVGIVLSALTGQGAGLIAVGGVLLLALALERATAGLRAWRQFGDTAAVAFPVVHLLRDLAWVSAICVWTCRRLLHRPYRPGHSMAARQPSSSR